MSAFVIAWDRDTQKWTVIGSRSREVVRSFPSLLAAEEWVLAQQNPKDAS